VTADAVGGGPAILDGFRIVGGQADGPDRLGIGGGLLRGAADVEVKNCVFRDNAADSGGAVAEQGCGGCATGGRMRFDDCTFEENAARDSGGAVAIGGFHETGGIDLERCTFRGNRCASGRDLYLAQVPQL